MKILIADDAEIIRTRLRKTMPWEDWGIDGFEEASDGTEALEKLSRGDIDIALLDIQMPGSTGLEVVEKNEALYPGRTRYIMITSFGEFGYVQRALRLGVCDYIMKPIDRRELEKAMRKCIADLGSTRELEDAETKNNILKGNHWFRSRLGNSPAGPERLEDVTGLEGVSCYLTFSEKEASSEMDDFLGGVMHFTFRPAPESKIRIHVVPCWRDGRTAGIHDEIMKKWPGITMMKASDTARSLSFIEKMMNGRRKELLSIEQEESFPRMRGIIVREARKLAETAGSLNPYRLRSEITALIKERIGMHLSAYDGRAVIDEYIYTLDSIAHEKGSHHEVMRSVRNDKFFLLRFRDTEELIDAMTELTMQVWNFEEKENLSVFERIERYIRDNPGKDLSTAALSEEFALSQGYISQLFKASSGKNLTTYIEEARMEEAMRLLNDSTMSVTEIAFAVGYNDAGYFGKVFKQYYGTTPSKVRADLQ